MLNVSTRHALAGVLAILTVTAWAGEVPQPVALALQLGCLVLAGADVLGDTFRPLWWVCTVGTVLALLLGIVIQLMS